MSSYILALDQGTTSCRSALVNHHGDICHIAQREFTQHFPKPGWVEHDAEEIWLAQMQTIQDVLRHGQDIAAIGITNQRETTLLWDRQTGQPLSRAIVWQDRRTTGMCERLRADGHELMIRQRTGLVVDAYFSGTKIAWLLDHLEGARERAERGELCFGTMDSWLVWQLTKGEVHITDATNASRTMLYNLHTGDWDADLCALLRVPMAILPTITESSGIQAEAQISENLRIPIAGIAGDQQSALFGQTCTEVGMAKNTYGTGCFMLMNIGDAPTISQEPLLTTVAWRLNGKDVFALEGSVFIAGALVQWLRDEMGFVADAAEIEAMASSVPDNGGVTVVPAFAGLGAPHWTSEARGTIFGLTRGTTKAHIARAALESIALQSLDVLKAMRAAAAVDLKILRVDGGAARNDLLMQHQADVLDLEVHRPKSHETTVLGAAFLAGLAVGFYKDLNAIHALGNLERVFEPARDNAWRADQTRQWDRAIAAVKTWANGNG